MSAPVHEAAAPITVRAARRGDGKAVWQLVKDAGTLELNSAYFYLLFAEHFGETCVVAERDGRVVGAIVGYRIPRDPEAVFVWQIGVAPEARKHGLASRMLAALVALPGCTGVRFLTATVATGNVPSQKLFRGFARDHGVACDESPFFTPDMFPSGHEAEELYRIGPLTPYPRSA